MLEHVYPPKETLRLMGDMRELMKFLLRHKEVLTSRAEISTAFYNDDTFGSYNPLSRREEDAYWQVAEKAQDSRTGWVAASEITTERKGAIKDANVVKDAVGHQLLIEDGEYVAVAPERLHEVARHM